MRSPSSEQTFIALSNVRYLIHIFKTVLIEVSPPNRNNHISSLCAANVHGIQVFLFLDEAGGGDLGLVQAFISILTTFCHKHKRAYV